MIRKSIILAAVAALAFSSLSGVAMAAPKAKSTTAAPAAAATLDPSKMTPAQIYDANHQGAVAIFTQFKTAITTDPDVSGSIAQLKTELAGLPTLEKAFIDAKNAGNEAAAKTAQDSYTASVQKIIDLAIPLDQGLLPMRAKMMGGFDQMGAIGAKLKAEKDIAGLIADIDAALKPLDDANTIVGPIQMAAVKAAQVRIKLEAKKIFSEELGGQVGNLLQQKLAQ
ncbi:hypothetical protein BH10CYA1_BH10CYA1_28370 [soil metagenome]